MTLNDVRVEGEVRSLGMGDSRGDRETLFSILMGDIEGSLCVAVPPKKDILEAICLGEMLSLLDSDPPEGATSLDKS